MALRRVCVTRAQPCATLHVCTSYTRTLFCNVFGDVYISALRVCMPLLAAIADSRQRFAKPVCALRLQLVWRGLMIVAIALMFSAVRAALRCAALRCVAAGASCDATVYGGATAAAGHCAAALALSAVWTDRPMHA